MHTFHAIILIVCIIQFSLAILIFKLWVVKSNCAAVFRVRGKNIVAKSIYILLTDENQKCKCKDYLHMERLGVQLFLKNEPLLQISVYLY